jgi:hypothetical protein
MTTFGHSVAYGVGTAIKRPATSPPTPHPDAARAEALPTPHRGKLDDDTVSRPAFAGEPHSMSVERRGSPS